MKLYTPERPAPWIGDAQQIFAENGACDFPWSDNEDDPTRWLREFPLGSWAVTCSVDAETYVSTVSEHFTFLEQECGIAIPSLEMQVSDRSFSEPSFSPALYVAAGHVHNARYPEFMRGPEVEKALRHLAGSLHKYVEWVHDTPQKLALFDVVRLSQYQWGKLIVGSEAPARLYLVDVGPALCPTQDTGNPIHQKWRDRVEELHEWSTGSLPPSPQV